MASVKLNKSLREAIAEDLTRHLRAQVEMVEKESAVLAKRLYDSLFSKKEQEQMNALPEGWLSTFDEFIVRDDDWNRYHLKMNFRERRPANLDPRISVGHPIMEGFEADMFWVQFEEWKGRLEQAKAEYKAAKDNALVVLNSVTTVGRLIEVWPEAEPATVRVGFRPQVFLPAINFTELNKTLGLPEGTAKVAA